VKVTETRSKGNQDSTVTQKQQKTTTQDMIMNEGKFETNRIINSKQNKKFVEDEPGAVSYLLNKPKGCLTTDFIETKKKI
jgi:16S rRNA U516 pseudouridylate synthase RsuA-like enzyme